MVKGPKKPKEKQNNTINSVLVDNKTTSKSKKEINNSYYQKNKEKLKFQRRDKYQQDKEAEKAKRKQRYDKKKNQAQLATQQAWGKYYEAENIQILMSLKQYTELNKDKMKLWADFNWTLKDCKEDIHDIVAVMKLREVADNLVRDYWETAKKEIRKGKSWNIISEEQQQKLIKYWGREKARIENGYIDTEEQLERQSQEYLKEIELAKFHEERGKKGCECWQCEEQKAINKRK